MRIAITCGHEVQSENRNSLSALLTSLPNHLLSPASGLPLSSSFPSQAFFSLPYAVNYAALTIKGVPYTHPDSPVLRLLAKYIEQKRIHPEVREKGGAYGGQSRFDTYYGIFKYISYRDPSFERSLEIMRNSGKWATGQKISEDDLVEMKLSTFKGIDAPISVKEEGMHEFLYGVTDEMRQMYHSTSIRLSLDGEKGPWL
jgi:presequence protease